jgi:fatty acid desaturase
VFGNFLSETKVFHYDELISLVLPAFMLVFQKLPITFEVTHRIFWQWMSIIMIASFLYTLFAVNSGHHSPEIVHEGDEFDNLDFGVFQIRAIVDRQAVDDHLFTVLGYYGLHTLHHMFPTLDHSILPKLEGIFLETCKDFSVEFRKKSVLSCVTDQFKQLARSEIRKIG